MPFDTALTRKLGIKSHSSRPFHWLLLTYVIPVPIVQGGMQWVGYAELASAVSNAGGLGLVRWCKILRLRELPLTLSQITALTKPSPEELRNEIKKCRKMTSKPFGVNLSILPAINAPDYSAYASVIIEESISIVETAGDNPGKVIKQLKDGNCIVIHKCTTIRHAQSAIRLGVDFLSIDGFECAGHVGESDITNFILLSRARQSLNVPFIASGGFADGRGLAAALALGAEGINMGTRFMCTIEAPIHQNIKQAIVDADETNTTLVLRRWRNTMRIFKNDVAKETVKIEKESSTGHFEEVRPLVNGQRGRQVFLNGDTNYGVRITYLLRICALSLMILCQDLDSWASYRPHTRYT